jgi:hypothetical protein
MSEEYLNIPTPTLMYDLWESLTKGMLDPILDPSSWVRNTS